MSSIALFVVAARGSLSRNYVSEQHHHNAKQGKGLISFLGMRKLKVHLIKGNFLVIDNFHMDSNFICNASKNREE